MADRKKYNFRIVAITAIITEILFWILLVAIYFSLLNYVPSIRFHYQKWAWLFLLVPGMTVLYLIAVSLKNRSLKRYADSNLVPFVVPDISSTRSVIKFLLFRFGVAFILLGLVDPKVGIKLQEVQTKGVDIMLCLDVSNSMKAEDIKPNRLERAKMAIYQLINNLEGDRVGIIVFAGSAYVQLPVTTDYEAAKLFLSGIDTDLMSIQGTAIGSAIELAVESFDPESDASKSIIVITDGENHEDNAIEEARLATGMGISVHAIGMGSVQGAPIPIYNRSGRNIGFKEDKNGGTVITALNENMLRDIVSAGNGVFTRASSNHVGLKELINDLDSMEETEMGTFAFSEYEHRFQGFLGFGLFLLLLEFLLAERKKSWSEQLNIFD